MLRLLSLFVLWTGVLACQAVWTTTRAADRPPNIVIILADDLGYADIGVHGGTLVPTPNIDRIAKEGVRFTRGYAASPICAVSRAGLLTGRNPARIGVEHNPITPNFAKALADRGQTGPHPGRLLNVPPEKIVPVGQMAMPGTEITLAEVLKARGYKTGIFGKWHLGATPDTIPNAQGFDRHVGFYSGAAKYAPADDPDTVRFELTWSTLDTFIVKALKYGLVRDGKPLESRDYMTSALAREAAAFIAENKDATFLAYVPFFSPHTPIEVPKSIHDRLPHIKDPLARAYAGLLVSLDEGVGTVLKALDDAGIADNTIVIFTSDNGGADYVGLKNINGPLRGWKATFLEGGIRVPVLIRWPRKIKPGQVRSDIVSHLDLAPTLAAMAGAEGLQDSDGRDIGQGLIVGSALAPKPLFWRSDHYRAVIDGDWKLMTSEDPKRVWLFNLAEDFGEKVNRAGRAPQTVRRLSALLADQEKRLRTPLWPSLVRLPVYFDVTEKEHPPSKDAEFIYWGG